MKIKQKLLTLGIITLTGIGGVLLPMTSQVAADCGGVATSIISCAQKGTCDDGSKAYEGTDPKTSTTAIATYKKTYNHDYGKCADKSAPKQDVQDSGIWGLLLMVINIMTAGVGILAIAGVVWGSIQYTSAGGSAEQIKKAKDTITNVVIGIVAYALMYALLNFLIPGGLFKP